MREFLAFLALGLLLSIAQTLYAGVVVAAVALVALAAIARPKQAVALLACVGLLGLALTQPVVCIAALTLVALAAVLKHRKRARPVQLLLSDQRTDC